MNKPIDQARDPLLKAALVALERAGLRAREIAAQTGTPLVVMKDGKLQHILPDQMGDEAVSYLPTKNNDK